VFSFLEHRGGGSGRSRRWLRGGCAEHRSVAVTRAPVENGGGLVIYDRLTEPGIAGDVQQVRPHAQRKGYPFVGY
jgi:hypothetical protein